MFGLNCLCGFKRVSDQVTERVYKRIRCRVLCVCVPNIPRRSLLPPHILPPPLLCRTHHLACELMLLSSRGVLCICGFAQLPRVFSSLLHCLGTSSSRAKLSQNPLLHLLFPISPGALYVQLYSQYCHNSDK